MSQNSLSHSAAEISLDEIPVHEADTKLESILERTGFDSLTRRRFLALGAVAGATTVIASGARADILDGLKKFLDLDPIVLNYAHELEEFQSEFFTRVTVSAVYQELTSRERGVFNAIASQDRAHFEALEALRNRIGARAGGRFNSSNASASSRPRNFTFPGSAFRDRQKMYNLAVEIKENSVGAYHGAVDLLREKRTLLEPAAAIAGVDGRHLVVLRELAGLDPIPMSFEVQISPQTVGNRLAKYGFKGGARRGGL